MRPLPLLMTVLTVFVVMAEPAMAQSIDLSPIQNLLQGIVDALTGRAWGRNRNAGRHWCLPELVLQHH